MREGFFDPINEMAQRGVAKFDFSAEIDAIKEGAALGSGVHYIPMSISKIVEIPEQVTRRCSDRERLQPMVCELPHIGEQIELATPDLIV